MLIAVLSDVMSSPEDSYTHSEKHEKKNYFGRKKGTFRTAYEFGQNACKQFAINLFQSTI